jgi:hypothetical protein
VATVAAPANIAYVTRIFRERTPAELFVVIAYFCASRLAADWALIIDSL